MWEVVARESIRDLVARYNAYGDAGRFDDLLGLFAPDATMELPVDGQTTTYAGLDEIRTIFTGTRDAWTGAATAAGAPAYVRHSLTTHQIDFVDAGHATGRAYFQVIKAHGLDHWGRYLDRYAEIDGHWRFTFRRAAADGYASDGASSGTPTP